MWDSVNMKMFKTNINAHVTTLGTFTYKLPMQTEFQ